MEQDPFFSKQNLPTLLASVFAVSLALYFFWGVLSPAPSPVSSGSLLSNDGAASKDRSTLADNEPVMRDGVYYLYFSNSAGAESKACAVLHEVARTDMNSGRGMEAAAVYQLVSGPTDAEKKNGLSSFLSEATMSALESVSVRGGVAYVNFTDLGKKIPATKWNCVRRVIQSSVLKTLEQFSTIKGVHLSINGSEELFNQWVARGQ